MPLHARDFICFSHYSRLSVVGSGFGLTPVDNQTDDKKRIHGKAQVRLNENMDVLNG